MRLSTATTAALSLFALSSSVAADRHAHPPSEALVKGGVPQSKLVTRHLQHRSSGQHHHKSKRGSCPKRLHKSQKVIGASYGGDDSNNGNSDNSSSFHNNGDGSNAPTNSKSDLKKATSTYVDSATSAAAASSTDDWKPESPTSSSSSWSSSSAWSESPKAAPTPAATPKKEDNHSDGGNDDKKGSGDDKKSSNNGGGGGALSGAGLLGFKDKTCGASGATDKISKTSGPNGSMDWLNCGLNGGGWTPPDLHIDQVSAMPLDEALEQDDSPFKACTAYKDIFDKYGWQMGIPPIVLASLAMQESSCNKDAMGDNGGAYGLMQITHDKCTAGINCSDPDYNIRTGAKYFKDRLDANGGNLLLALGQYNGWYKGLTVAKATAIKGTCCQCQNNINYFQQMLNGWFQNVDGHSLGDWNMGC